MFGFVLLWLLNLLVIVKLIKMTSHTRLEKIQPLPIMDGMVLVTIHGLMHGATNEQMASMLKDQIESNVGSWKNCSNLYINIDKQ